MAFFANAISNASFVLDNAAVGPLCALGAIGLAVLLSSRRARRYLADPKTLILALSLFGLWILLIPYAVAWGGVEGRHGLWWPIIPNWAVLLSWPLLAHRLVRRMADARKHAIIYVACNVPGLVFTWFVTVIIVGADWI